MSAVPDNIWPCCYLIAQTGPGGKPITTVGAFMVRAASHADEIQIANAFAANNLTYPGWSPPHVTVNGVAGEAAVVSALTSATVTTGIGGPNYKPA